MQKLRRRPGQPGGKETEGMRILEGKVVEAKLLADGAHYAGTTETISVTVAEAEAGT